MHPFELNLPTKIIFGPGSLSKLQKNIKGLGKKALIIIGQGSVKKNGYLDQVLDQLHTINVETVLFEGIEPNPIASTIDKAADLARREKPRYVIALGGGSVMDAAKCIAMLAVNPGIIWDYAYKGIHTDFLKFQNSLPLVTIPTVAATSSEADSYAVVTNPDTIEKCTVFGQSFYPIIAIVDPALTTSVPKSTAIDGAVDIIAHVLESYLSTNDDTPLQDQCSLAIVKTVMDNLSKILKDPNDIDARAQLSWCSTIALSGFLSGRDGGWPIHAIEHALSAHYNISHGAGLALLLPPIMRYDLNGNAKKIAQLGSYLFNMPKTDNVQNDASTAIHIFQEWINNQGNDYSLTGLGVQNINYERIAEDVIRLCGNFKGYLLNLHPMSQQDIVSILQAIK